jgi:hypothetical protein
MGEFGLIDAYFKERFAPLTQALARRSANLSPSLTLGIGDDCALLPCKQRFLPIH